MCKTAMLLVSGLLRRMRQTSNPVLSGRCTSSRTSVGLQTPARRTASSPEPASTTLKPAWRRTRVRAYRSPASSSTFRMTAGDIGISPTYCFPAGASMANRELVYGYAPVLFARAGGNKGRRVSVQQGLGQLDRPFLAEQARLHLPGQHPGHVAPCDAGVRIGQPPESGNLRRRPGSCSMVPSPGSRPGVLLAAGGEMMWAQQKSAYTFGNSFTMAPSSSWYG